MLSKKKENLANKIRMHSNGKIMYVYNNVYILNWTKRGTDTGNMN